MRQAENFSFDFQQTAAQPVLKRARTNALLAISEEDQERAEFRFYQAKARFKGHAMPDEMIGDFQQLSHILHAAKHQDGKENKEFPMHFVIAVDRIFKLWSIRKRNSHEVPINIIMAYLHRSIDVFESRTGQPVRHLVVFTTTKIRKGKANFL